MGLTKKYFKYLFILTIILLLPVPAIPGPPTAVGGTRVLTLEDALQIAAEKNRDIRKAREYIQWARGKYVEERAAALPQVVVTGVAGRDQDESQKLFAPMMAERQQKLTGDVGFSQPLFTWGQIGAAIRAAREGLKSADEQLRLYRQAAQRDVTASFYDVLLAKELRLLAVQNLEQKSRHLEEAERRHEAGTATDYDVLAARVAVENARPEVIRTDNQVQTLRERLRHLLAVDEAVDASGRLDVPVSPYPAYDTVFDTARKRRPELADLKHRVETANELIRVANASNKPRLDLKGGYGWRKLEVMDNAADGPAWSIGLHLSVPVFDGLRTKGKVAQAESDLRRLQIDEAGQVDAVALEARNALHAVREAEEIVKAISGTVTQSERLLSMAETGYTLGVKIRLEVDDAELNLRQARGNLSRARRDYVVARTNLDWVMGILGETALE